MIAIAFSSVFIPSFGEYSKGERSGILQKFSSKGFLAYPVMATNKPTGDNKRIGAIKDRSQTFNPQNERWTKRDSNTGKFIDQKYNKAPFKGVRREK